MSYPENQSTLIKRLSALFILWLGLWLILLLCLPRAYYTVLFFLSGIAPILGWFLIRPRRIIWFFMIFFGINKLDD